MKLEFDSMDELEHFLIYAAHIGRAFQTAPEYSIEQRSMMVDHASINSQMDQATVSENGVSTEPASPPAGDLAGNEPDAVGAPMPAASEPAKRKRRTKAEMEAERAAPTPLVAAAPPAPGNPNPFAVSAGSQAVLDAPNQGAATLAGIAAMQNADTAPEPVSTVHERALQILVDPAQTESIAHLRACQGFIQAHGMTKYNESFREGLTANIAAYTPEQRALHIAILESLA